MARFKFNDDNVLVSVDIGTSAIRCLVSLKKSNHLERLSFYEKKVSGLDEGRIINFNEVLPVISSVLEESERLSGRSFSEIVLGFSTDFYSFQSHGMAALPSREVTIKDIDLAIQTACAVPIPNHHLRIHNKAQEFSVDGKGGIVNPLGLSGLRLETNLQIVSIPQFYCQDMTKVLKVLGFTPRGFIHNLMAFGESLASPSQKQEGVCVCDIGHKSTRLIFYKHAKIVDMIHLPIGGYHFTLALAEKFKISPLEARNLKESWGALKSHSVSEIDQIASEEEGLFFSQKSFVNVLEGVAETLFTKIKNHTESKSLMKDITAGFIFTGSTSFLDGFLDMARLHLPQPVSYCESINSEKNNFKEINTLAIAQQFYFREKFQTKNPTLLSGWAKVKDLF